MSQPNAQEALRKARRAKAAAENFSGVMLRFTGTANDVASSMYSLGHAVFIINILHHHSLLRKERRMIYKRMLGAHLKRETNSPKG